MQPRNDYPYSRGSALIEGLLVDVTEEAKKEGIDYPVAITAELARLLNPRPFLAEMGLSLEGRVKNLMTFLKQHLVPLPERTGDGLPEGRFAIPFLALQGPLIQEKSIPVIAIVHPGDSGEMVVTLTRAKDGEDTREY